MKKVLVIAYFFPPVGGGGVQRTLKFVKYLPSLGWLPVVLTPKNAKFGFFDHTLVGEIPAEVKIFQTALLEPPRWYASIRERIFIEGGTRETSSPKGSWFRRAFITLIKPLFNAGRWFAHNLIFVPDIHVGWIPFAVWRGLKIVKKEKIDVIYATGDPWSDFLIGFFLSRITGKPLVIDMRDPWTLSPDVKWNNIRTFIERFWERRCINAAYRVINVTEQVTQAYRQAHRNVDPSKFVCITQGFDPPDFEIINGVKAEKFTISATGTYFDFRTPESFLKALRSLVDSKPWLGSQIRVRFMGVGGCIVQEFVEKYDLAEIVKLSPYGTHRESIQFVMDSDVVLLDFYPSVSGRANMGSTSSRVFEYLGSGKPILGLVYPQGAAAEVIRLTNSGVVVDPGNTEEVAEAIHGLYLRYAESIIDPNQRRDLTRFTRKSLTKQLAQIMDEALFANL